MIKRTIGFNWGAAGLGMSEWGGCHLADVLASLGAPTDPAAWDGGGHVCFRGPDKELPGGADGSYGTSLTLRYVMDKSNDVILAWEPVWKSTTGLGGPHQTSELSISVTSKSIRLIFGRIDCSRRVLEAKPKRLRRNGRIREH